MLQNRSLIFFTLFTALLLISTPAWSWDNKFEKEVKAEKHAVKLVREIQRGGYDVVTTEELKKWRDEGKDMVIVDTMPFEDSYKKAHVPGAVQFLFPIPDMNSWDEKETAGKTQQVRIRQMHPQPQRCGLGEKTGI